MHKIIQDLKKGDKRAYEKIVAFLHLGSNEGGGEELKGK